MSSVIDEKGRITIPKEIRDDLDLKPGEEIEFILVNQQLIIQKKISKNKFMEITEKLSNEYSKQHPESIDVEKLF